MLLFRGGLRRSLGVQLSVAPVMSSARRCFGNAPSRSRPSEEVPAHHWTQTARELSGLVVVAGVIVVPIWAVIMWREGTVAEKERTLAWAQRYASSSDPWGRKGASQQNLP